MNSTIREEEIPLAQERLPIFQAAAAAYTYPDELVQPMVAALGPSWLAWVLLAIDSRESRFGLLLQNGLGDGGHGHGELQIDDRSHAAFCAAGRWQDLAASLDYVHKNVIVPAFNSLGDQFELFNEDYVALFWAAIAAYNCGPGPGQDGTKGVLGALEQGLEVDANTTGGNYSVDIKQRAAIFRQRLEGVSQPAPAASSSSIPLFQSELTAKFGAPREGARYLTVISLKEFAGALGHVKDFEGNPWSCRIYGHGLLAAPLRRAFGLVVSRGLAGELRTFDGCFCIRPMTSGGGPSVHSWALAVDLNAKQNPYGGPIRFSHPFILCFAEAGFEAGALWHTPDGMHFQLPWTQDWRQSSNPLRPGLT